MTDTDTLCKLAEAATHDIVNRLNRVADERRTASCHDEKIAMFVVARISRDDAKLMDEAAAEITALRAKVKAQEDALEGAESIFTNCKVSANVCCCGNKEEDHGMGTEHSFVDMGEHAASKWLKSRRAAQEAGNE